MKHTILLLIFCSFLRPLPAQEDLLSQLEAAAPPARDFTVATFKSIRLVNGHSTEQPSEGELQFLIAHRFGRIGTGGKEFFGLDQASMRIGAEYGITENICVGFGRSNVQKVWDGFVKWRIVRQQKGMWNIPLTISFFASASIRSDEFANPERKNYFSSRMAYTYQLLIARKFGQWFSLQLMPTLVHRNLVATQADRNDVFALGIGGSLRISRNARLNAEYYYVFPGQIASTFNNEAVRNSLSIGFDIETGGHVFQLHFTNSRSMIEKGFITETTGDWFPKDFKNFGVQFGFNISRSFALYQPKKKMTMYIEKKPRAERAQKKQ